MKPYIDDGDLRFYQGDVRDVLPELESGIAQMCVTSPPYWGLRDYNTGEWVGGDAACDHTRPPGGTGGDPAYGPNKGNAGGAPSPMGQTCIRCGAVRVDSQIGLEPTPGLYVERLVEVFRQVRRVLRDDGVLFLNIGDSYAAGAMTGQRGPNSSTGFNAAQHEAVALPPRKPPDGLKPKDLVGIPWRVAFALQADGWYLRSDIIWSKPNPMPESIRDRPTKSHEYVFLFSKQPRYYWDQEAVREPATYAGRHVQTNGNDGMDDGYDGHRTRDGFRRGVTVGDGRNIRSVWTIPTQPFPEAHFAVYPEELARRCILAGSSERGGCAECGAPWRRVTSGGESTYVERKALGYDQPANMRPGEFVGHHNGIHPPGMSHDLDPKPRQTTGWEPSCFCEDKPLGELAIRPQLVLDPFIGSGTTSLVARTLGRHSIGIDLSAEYLDIAANRTRQLSLLTGG